MNDRDLWPVHIIFFGFLIALILYALKTMLLEFLENPALLLIASTIVIAAWLVLRRR